MTKEQVEQFKQEYERKWIELNGKFGESDVLVMIKMRDWVISKLQAVEGEIYEKWKYHSHSGLSGNFAVFMGWETAPDITVVYENGYKFIRSDKIEEYLKSNKLEK